MKKTIITSLAIFSGIAGSIATGFASAGCPSGTIAQGIDPQTKEPICVIANAGGGSSGGNTPTPSGGSMVASPSGGSVPHWTSELEYTDLCMTNLANLATKQLQAQLLKDKAVSSQVHDGAKISGGELGANCAKTCTDFAFISSKISWANSVYIADSPTVLMEKKALKFLPKPPMPGNTEMQSCMPAHLTQNWCPTSGTGVGAGSSRIENPLDKIKVCISSGDALKHMNFSAADAANNCARPSIVDAALRIEAEHKCVKDAKEAKDAKDIKEAKEAAALKLANTSAAAPTASTIPPLSTPPQPPRKH